MAPHAAPDLDVALPKLSFECDGAPVKRAATATASFEAPAFTSALRVE